MKIQGKIKAITFKGERVSVLLEDARIFKEDYKDGTPTWMPYTDIDLVKDGKYKKGETWLSSFKNHIYQACEELKKMGTGIEVDVEVVVGKAGFKNIEKIALAVPEKDVNADLVPPDAPEEDMSPFDESKPGGRGTARDEPSSTQRPKDSPEAQAEEMSTGVDKVVKIRATEDDIKIIRQTCIKAAGMATNGVATNDEIVALAKRLEKYVLSGE